VDIADGNKILNFRNNTGETLIHAILQNSSSSLNESLILNIIKKLVHKNVSVNAMNEYNQTAMHFASQKGYYDIINYLFSLKTDFNKVDNYGNAPIHYLIDNFVADCKEGEYFKLSNKKIKKTLSLHNYEEITDKYMILNLINEMNDFDTTTTTTTFNTSFFIKKIRQMITYYKFFKIKDINNIIENKKKDIDNLYLKRSTISLEPEIKNILFDSVTQFHNLYKDCTLEISQDSKLINDDTLNEITVKTEQLITKCENDFNSNITKLLADVSTIETFTINNLLNPVLSLFRILYFSYFVYTSVESLYEYNAMNPVGKSMTRLLNKVADAEALVDNTLKLEQTAYTLANLLYENNTTSKYDVLLDIDIGNINTATFNIYNYIINPTTFVTTKTTIQTAIASVNVTKDRYDVISDNNVTIKNKIDNFEVIIITNAFVVYVCLVIFKYLTVANRTDKKKIIKYICETEQAIESNVVKIIKFFYTFANRKYILKNTDYIKKNIIKNTNEGKNINDICDDVLKNIKNDNMEINHDVIDNIIVFETIKEYKNTMTSTRVTQQYDFILLHIIAIKYLLKQAKINLDIIKCKSQLTLLIPKFFKCEDMSFFNFDVIKNDSIIDFTKLNIDYIDVYDENTSTSIYININNIQHNPDFGDISKCKLIKMFNIIDYILKYIEIIKNLKLAESIEIYPLFYMNIINEIIINIFNNLVILKKEFDAFNIDNFFNELSDIIKLITNIKNPRYNLLLDVFVLKNEKKKNDFEYYNIDPDNINTKINNILIDIPSNIANLYTKLKELNVSNNKIISFVNKHYSLKYLKYFTDSVSLNPLANSVVIDNFVINNFHVNDSVFPNNLSSYQTKYFKGTVY
jgi:hypothetical protein